jgi:hypothetical protein
MNGSDRAQGGPRVLRDINLSAIGSFTINLTRLEAAATKEREIHVC